VLIIAIVVPVHAISPIVQIVLIEIDQIEIIAYAPDGKPDTKVQVGMKVGNLSKTFMVVGNRKWEAGTGINPGYPELFESLPITYDTAFGGVDKSFKNKKKHKAFMLNPVGQGFHAYLDSDYINGTPMPNTEEVGNPIKLPNLDYKPMSFGPIARSWEPRYRYAGTYDDAYMEDKFYPLSYHLHPQVHLVLQSHFYEEYILQSHLLKQH